MAGWHHRLDGHGFGWTPTNVSTSVQGATKGPDYSFGTQLYQFMIRGICSEGERAVLQGLRQSPRMSWKSLSRSKNTFVCFFKALIDRAYDHCRQILSDNREKLQAVVDFLLEKESMTGEQFEAIMKGEEVGESSATAMFDGFAEE